MKRDPFEIVGSMLDGRYRVDEVVGEGGFGVVYRAFHPGFDAAIAIKVLKVPAGLKAEERDELLATFQQEGKLLFALSKVSATFVQVLEQGVLRRPGMPVAPYLVLEWLHGRTLDAHLVERRARGQGRHSLDEVIALLDPIAEALALAHSDWKVAHRDVKPENIFLVRGTRGGITTKLLDFGIAKVMTSTGPAALSDPTLRGFGGFTPQYAAPEQWNQKYGRTGPWSDVYALALVCVELLAGRPALEADEPGQFFGATIDPERPTPSRRGIAVSPWVEQVFLRALSVRPEDRYREMRSFWEELKAANAERASAPGAGATPLPRPGQVIAPLALAPTAPATTQVLSGPPQMGSHAPQAPGTLAATASMTAVAQTAGAPNAALRGRVPLFLSVAFVALTLGSVSAGLLLSREVDVAPAGSEAPGAGPASSAGPSSSGEPSPSGVPSSEAPGTAPLPSSSGSGAVPTLATVGGALSEPPGAAGSSSARAGSNACRQKADCKDGKLCVQGACRHAECATNHDCWGPKKCRQNKCEWASPL